MKEQDLRPLCIKDFICWLADGLFHTGPPPQKSQLPIIQQRPSAHKIHAFKLGKSCLVSPAMSTLSIAALVEGSHWLICRTGLKLHEVGTGMFTFWTWLWQREKQVIYITQIPLTGLERPVTLKAPPWSHFPSQIVLKTDWKHSMGRVYYSLFRGTITKMPDQCGRT